MRIQRWTWIFCIFLITFVVYCRGQDTGGSLGTQPKRFGDGLSLYAMQFESDRVLSYYIALALWAVGLYIWWRVDRSMDRYALDAASQDEEAAASVGINVTREKLKITAISAAMCAVGGAIYGQYQMYIGPDTIAGLGVSLNIVFAVIAGGMWVMLGPTVGAVFTQVQRRPGVADSREVRTCGEPDESDEDVQERGELEDDGQ